jgi:hypothetical protein
MIVSAWPVPGWTRYNPREAPKKPSSLFVWQNQRWSYRSARHEDVNKEFDHPEFALLMKEKYLEMTGFNKTLVKHEKFCVKHKKSPQDSCALQDEMSSSSGDGDDMDDDAN